MTARSPRGAGYGEVVGRRYRVVLTTAVQRVSVLDSALVGKSIQNHCRPPFVPAPYCGVVTIISVSRAFALPDCEA